MTTKQLHRLPGFTLLEILVVLTIIGLLLSFIAPVVLDRPNQARELKLQNDLQAIKAALSMYYLDFGTLPSESQGLDSLSKKDADYIYLAEPPEDPWSNPYQYRVRGSGDAVIFSFGPDGDLGGGDDIELEISR